MGMPGLQTPVRRHTACVSAEVSPGAERTACAPGDLAKDRVPVAGFPSDAMHTKNRQPVSV